MSVVFFVPLTISIQDVYRQYTQWPLLPVESKKKNKNLQDYYLLTILLLFFFYSINCLQVQLEHGRHFSIWMYTFGICSLNSMQRLYKQPHTSTNKIISNTNFTKLQEVSCTYDFLVMLFGNFYQFLYLTIIIE